MKQGLSYSKFLSKEIRQQFSLGSFYYKNTHGYWVPTGYENPLECINVNDFTKMTYYTYENMLQSKCHGKLDSDKEYTVWSTK
jgi:hypothetical protein